MKTAKRVGIDIGYFQTKVVTPQVERAFLSVVGDRFSGFGLSDVDGIQFDDPAFVAGESAAYRNHRYWRENL